MLPVHAGTLSHNHGSLPVEQEQVPVVPLKPSVLAADAFDARVVLGTAVDHVTAAHSIRIWAAAPCYGGHPAAGHSILAGGVVVTVDVRLLHRPELGMMLRPVDGRQWDGLQLQHDELVTGPGADVAAVALRAAVLLIWAAHGVLQWAAAPLACRELTAGGVFRALIQRVALHTVRISLDAAAGGGGCELGVPWDHQLFFDAGRPTLVASVVVRAAVLPIVAAYGLWQWAAAPLF